MTFPFRKRGEQAEKLTWDGTDPPPFEAINDARRGLGLDPIETPHHPDFKVDVVNRSDHWQHDNDRLAAVFKALLSRPENSHIGKVYVASGKYAARLTVYGEVTIDGIHEEVIRRYVPEADTTDEESGFSSTHSAETEES